MVSLEHGRAVHPFLDDEFLFDWSSLKAAAVEPDIREALRRARAAVDTFKLTKGADLTYVKVLLGFEATTKELSRAWGLVSHLDSVLNSPELRKAYNAMMPEVTAFYTSLTLDPELWAVFKAYAATAEAQALTGVRRRFLVETMADFEENGADLPAAGKERLAALNAALAEKTQKYSENVLDSTNAWELFIDDEKCLAGLPASALAAAKQSATSKSRPEAWRFTLQSPSVFPVLQYADDEDLRRQCWEGLGQVGLKDAWDNTALVGEILALRHEKARLLGKQHFADFTTARRMARTGETALKFIEDIGQRIRPKFQAEGVELEQYRAAKVGDKLRSLHPWEFGYFSEKMRRELHGFDDEALRPWFQVDGVIAGMFTLFGGLFGIQVVARDTVFIDQTSGAKMLARAADPRVEGAPVNVWHPEVRFYEVRDGTRLLGSFYTDWFPRESKRGGAWMNFFRTGGPRPDGSFAPHLGLMCGNFTPPVAGKPALLTHDEVTTVFHEFGHLLHHLLSEVEVESLSGVRVAWDFVELPSQILENWCWEEESLALFARHHETGASLPSDLLAKLDASSNFRSASTCMRQLAFSKLDLDLHIRAEELKGRDLDSHWNEDFAEWQSRTTRRGPAMARRFNHLFSEATGYAAGYYSYKWAEALEADAFTRFLKEGVLNPLVGRELRTKVLAKGNSEPAEKLFRDFMGRDLDSEALLVRDGLA
jgi:oligopeptidase A